MSVKKETRLRRARKARLKMRELEAVRLCVHRSSQHIYAQVLSADGGKVLASASTLDKNCVTVPPATLTLPRKSVNWSLSALKPQASLRWRSTVLASNTTVV